MSSSARKLLAIKRATDKFEVHTAVLVAEIDRGTSSRAALEALLELCALYAGATGGTLVTQGLQRRLEPLYTRVQALPHLREVQPTMQLDIEIAELCPQCRAPGRLSLEGGAFCCLCSGCYDGTEDAHLGSQVMGHGKTARAAVADWLEQSEAHVPQHVGYWPTSIATVARAEFQRTAGWVQTETTEGIWYAPEILEAAE